MVNHENMVNIHENMVNIKAGIAKTIKNLLLNMNWSKIMSIVEVDPQAQC